MFNKILIANRGEIAGRIAKACKKLQVQSVGVYSLADKNSPHLNHLDESICIGPASSTGSYLNMEAIIQAGLQQECQAIHPGYGFLAENYLFALLCQQYKLSFIGPSAGIIRKMGDKNMARKAMLIAGLPVIPGSKGIVADKEQEEAAKIGYPLLLKAAAGGGGKGMRLCKNEQELQQNFPQVKMEAAKAFGNSDIYMEKFIEKGRHIEFQILADSYGNVVHLGERECSIQRNHQKLIEESPSPVMTSKMRNEMGKKAVAAVKEIGYVNAGTIEFLLEDKNNLYFMEMNTRLQVEHPVTEMVTGIDIVKEQICIAANHKLEFSQKDINFTGHAIECRINAEDPENNFKPSPGTITKFIPPTLDPKTLRLDTHIEQGYTIPAFYDSMIGKLIVWEQTRKKAIATMKKALQEFTIEGVKTTIPLHLQILETKEFQSGNYDTKFIEKLL